MNMSRLEQVSSANQKLISGIDGNDHRYTPEMVIAAMLLQISETLAIIADNTTPDKAIEEEGEK